MNLDQARNIVELTLHEYSKVRNEYWSQVHDGVKTYLSEEDKDEEWFKKTMETAIQIAFYAALAVAWLDSGNKRKIGASVTAFVAAQVLAEMGFVESLVYSLRLLKIRQPMVEDIEPELEPLTEDEIEEQASDRADGYSRSLDGIYNNSKVMAAGSQILKFVGEDGLESCYHCQRYKNQKHPAWWWVKHDAVPPNRRFDCKGYNCYHVLEDENGRLFTI